MVSGASVADVAYYVNGKFVRLNVSGMMYNMTDNKSIIVSQLYFNEDGTHIYVIGSSTDGTLYTEGDNNIDLKGVESYIQVRDFKNLIN